MAAAAHARYLERARIEQERVAAERAEYERRMAEEQRAEFEAGPPDGCRDCYVWTYSPFGNGWVWSHVTIEEGDCTCYHECHSEPVPCAPVVLG